MKFNITFVIRGAARTVDAPNTSNPVESENLASLLLVLANNLPGNGLVQTVGVHVTPAPDDFEKAGGRHS